MSARVRAGALLSALLMILLAGPGLLTATATTRITMVFSTTPAPASCNPDTDPNCVCDDLGRCRISIPIITPPHQPGPVDPPSEPIPGPPGGPPGGPTDPPPAPPPPILLPPPGEIWELCAIGQAPPPGFICPAPGDPIPDPGEPLPPTPTEEEVLRLITELQLPTPQIGSAPCSGPGCMGAVGLPVWLWTQPWQTYTDTAVIRIYEITLSATPIRVDWSMGDGSVISCHNAGTPYLTSYGITHSPTCGYIYERTSANQPGQAYTLSATMTYQVTWSGVVSGTTTHTLTDSTPVRIGEYQTVITHNN